MRESKKQKVVIIGGEGTPWSIKNADWVAKAGFDTHLLCFSGKPLGRLPKDVHITTHELQISLCDRIRIFFWYFLSVLFTFLGWFKFRMKTGRNPQLHDIPLADNPIIAKKKAAILDQLKPDIIIGHCLSSTGLTLANTSTGKKVAIGWGSDFTESFFSSALNNHVYRTLCKKIDLFICAGQTALEALGTNFHINPEKLLRSNFVDNQIEKLIRTPLEKSAIRTTMKIPLDAKVVFNARRFNPVFGGPQGFLACIQIAKLRNDVWFIFIEGRNNRKCFDKYVKKLNGLPVSISKRFIMERGELPFSRIMEIFSISDVFLSLRKKGDMRSATVIQGAAMGVFPVLSDCLEWKLMKNNGFKAFLVDPDKPVELMDTILQALKAPKDEIAQKNPVYLEFHENDKIYFQRFSTALRKLKDQ